MHDIQLPPAQRFGTGFRTLSPLGLALDLPKQRNEDCMLSPPEWPCDELQSIGWQGPSTTIWKAGDERNAELSAKGRQPTGQNEPVGGSAAANWVFRSIVTGHSGRS